MNGNIEYMIPEDIYNIFIEIIKSRYPYTSINIMYQNNQGITASFQDSTFSICGAKFFSLEYITKFLEENL